MKFEAALADPFVARLRERLARRSPERGEYGPPIRMAAVALLLRVSAAGPELLLIKRAVFEADPWSGHVALPGGREEENDNDLRHTAVRETREEIAVDVDSEGCIIGILDDVVPRTPRLPPIVIRPYVGIVNSDVAPVLNHEVAAAFWVPLERINHPAARVNAVVKVRGGEIDVEGYQIDEHLVWGLTERILRNFFDVLDDR